MKLTTFTFTAALLAGGLSAQATSAICNGSGTNPVALGTTAANPLPCLGCSWELQIDHTTFQPNATFDFFVGSIGACEGRVNTIFGEVLWRPFESVFTEARVKSGTLLLDVPNDTSFIGLPMSVAGASFTLGTNELELTNAVDGVVGN